jgi:hypothetical protein
MAGKVVVFALGAKRLPTITVCVEMVARFTESVTFVNMYVATPEGVPLLPIAGVGTFVS